MNVEVETGSPSRDWLDDAVRRISEFGLVGLLVAVIIAFTIVSGSTFLSFDNFVGVLRAAAPVGIAAIGLTIVLAMRDFDLSIAAVASIAGVVLASAVDAGWGPLAVLLALLVAAAVGIVNGLLIAYAGTHPFITTLGMAAAVQGLVYVVTDGSIFVTASEYPLGWLNDKVIGVHMSVWLLAVLFLAAGVLMEQSPLGRQMRAIGGSREGALQAGIKVARSRALGYIFSAVFAGIAGLVIVTMQQVAQPTSGDAILLPAFAAVFLGAVAVRAIPEPNHLGTLLGMFLVALVANGLTIANASAAVQPLTQGGLLVLALAVGGARRMERAGA